MASAPTSTATTVTEAVKESLLGHEEEQPLPDFSAQTKAIFEKYAHKDETTGELVMNEEEFVDAIAPKDQDYVSLTPAHVKLYWAIANILETAQDPPRAIRHPFPGRRLERKGRSYYQ